MPNNKGLAVFEMSGSGAAVHKFLDDGSVILGSGSSAAGVDAKTITMFDTANGDGNVYVHGELSASVNLSASGVYAVKFVGDGSELSGVGASRTAVSNNSAYNLALFDGTSTESATSLYVDSDGAVTYNPSTDTLAAQTASFDYASIKHLSGSSSSNMELSSEQDMVFVIDANGGGTQNYSFKTGTTEIASMDEDGGLTLTAVSASYLSSSANLTVDGNSQLNGNLTVKTGGTVDLTGATLTLDNDAISGDKVEGGTIAATTITALTTAGITATADIDIGDYELRAQTLESDVATGTAPLTVASTTLVSNLNADLLDGQQGSYYTDFSNMTVDDDEISGDKVEGGTIAATTITALTTAGITATANIDIGAYDLRAATLTADGLTSGRVLFAGTDGVLSDDSGFSYDSSTDTLTVANLNVNGTTTTIDTTNLEVSDKEILISKGALSNAATDGAGILVDYVSASILWDNDSSAWELNKDVNVTGALSASVAVSASHGAFAYVTGDGSGLTNVAATSIAADDIAAGDAAVTITTTSGDLTLQSQAGAVDIDADSGALSLDGSAGINIGTEANVAVDFHASTLDIDATGAVSIDSTSTVILQGNAGAGIGDDTESLAYDGSGNVDFDAVALDIDASSNIDILAGGTFSIDGTGASNVTADDGTLTLSSTTTGNVEVDAAGNAEINAAGGINIGNDSVAQKITVGGDTTTRTEVELNAILLDLHAGTGGVAINTAGNFGITGSSGGEHITVETTDGDIALTTVDGSGGGDILLASNGSGKGVNLSGSNIYLDADTMHLDSGTGLMNVDAGQFDLDATSNGFQLEGQGDVSTINSTGQNLTLSTTTSGVLALNSVNNLDLDGQTVTMNSSAGAITIESAAAMTLTSTGGTATINAAGQTLDVDALTVDIDATTVNADAGTVEIVSSANSGIRAKLEATGYGAHAVLKAHETNYGQAIVTGYITNISGSVNLVKSSDADRSHQVLGITSRGYNTNEHEGYMEFGYLTGSNSNLIAARSGKTTGHSDAAQDSSLMFNTTVSGSAGAASVTRMTVSSSGEVGIGTTTPDHQLTVVGDISASVNVSASQYYGDGSQLSGISADNLDVDASTNTSLKLVMVESIDSNQEAKSDADIEYNATANVLTVPNLSGSTKLATARLEDAGTDLAIQSGGTVDLDATGAITIDGASTLSIDAVDDSNLTVTAEGKDLDIAVAGGGAQELRLASAGTGASALHLNASAGGINIDSAGVLDIDSTQRIDLSTDQWVNIYANGGPVQLNSSTGVTMLRAGSQNQLEINVTDTDGVAIELQTDGDDLVFKQYDANEVMRITDDRKLKFFDDGDEYIQGDGSNLTLSAGNKLVLSGALDASGVNVTSDATFAQNVVISGDLTINGTTTTVSTTNLDVEDALIVLQAEQTGESTSDLGIIMERGTTGDNAAMIWDEGADKFLFGTTTETGADADVTVTVGTVQVGKLEIDGTDDYIDASTNLTFVSNADIVLDPGSGDVKADGALLPNTADGFALGSADNEWSDLYLADGGTVKFGNGQEMEIAHNASQYRLQVSGKGVFGFSSLTGTSDADDRAVLDAISATPSNYNGHMFYLTGVADTDCSAASQAEFNQANKFYFVENGTIFVFPFTTE